MKKIYIFSLSLLFGLITMQPVSAKNDCSAVAIDNDTSDWADITPLLSDDEDLTGTVYYYNGTAWSTTASDNDLYSTSIIAMQDLETVKVCNSATQLQLYIDAYHPLLAYQDVATETYYEFGDPDGADGELGLPADLDFWLVFKMQKVDSTQTYYYAVYLYAEAGDLGLESGPRQIAIYQEVDDVDFTSATFDPNEDELLAEISSSESKTKSQIQGEGGKNIDASGGFETGPMLMNADGNGLFNMTEIVYGEVLKMAVEIYDGSVFTKAITSRSILAVGPIDSTSDTEYRVQRIGVIDVRIPAAKRQDDQVRVQWEGVSDARKYQVRLFAKNGKVLKTMTTSKTQLTLKNLQSQTRYRVSVRAKVGELYTAWSDKKTFMTK